MIRRRLLTAVAVGLLVACGARTASAAPVTTIVNNGLPTQRVDVTVMGDGYTAAEMEKYRNDAQNFVSALFAQEPFKEYQSYFNVHRIDLISNRSRKETDGRRRGARRGGLD